MGERERRGWTDLEVGAGAEDAGDGRGEDQGAGCIRRGGFTMQSVDMVAEGGEEGEREGVARGGAAEREDADGARVWGGEVGFLDQGRGWGGGGEAGGDVSVDAWIGARVELDGKEGARVTQGEGRWSWHFEWICGSVEL